MKDDSYEAYSYLMMRMLKAMNDDDEVGQLNNNVSLNKNHKGEIAMNEEKQTVETRKLSYREHYELEINVKENEHAITRTKFEELMDVALLSNDIEWAKQIQKRFDIMIKVKNSLGYKGA